MSYGWQNPWKKREILNAEEYMVIMNEMQLNDGNLPRYNNEQVMGAGVGTDWQDETFYYNAPVQNHQVSVSGGSDDLLYFLSFGFFDQAGIVGGNYDKSNYRRYSLRSNSTYTVFEADDRSFLNKVTVGANIGYSRDKSTGIETNSEYGSILGSALTFSPLVSVYADEATAAGILAQYPHAVTDGDRVFSLPPAGFQEIANPVAMLHQPSAGFNNSDKFVSSFWGELQILPELKFRTTYGADLAFWGYDSYTFPYFLATQGKDQQFSTVQSEMNRVIAGSLKTTSPMPRASMRCTTSQPWPVYRHHAIATATLAATTVTCWRPALPRPTSIQPSQTDNLNVPGWYRRIRLHRYSLLFWSRRLQLCRALHVAGHHASRRFHQLRSQQQWGVFPSFSVGWNMTNEAFMANRPEWFDYMKLRFSWGKNGNDRIGNFLTLLSMNGGQNYYFGGGYQVNEADPAKVGEITGSMQYGSSPGYIPNPNVKWEESVQTDLGLEARFLNSRLTFGFDYFVKATNDMLMYQPIPSYVGLGAPIANVGDMENRGVEFELGWKNSAGDFNYFIAANASYLQNKLINLGNETGEQIYENAGASGVGSYVKGMNGEVFPYFYGFKTDGLFQSQAEVDGYVNGEGARLQPTAKPGDVRFVGSQRRRNHQRR